MRYNIRPEACYVYLVLCNDGTYYTILTDHLVKRFEAHINGVYEDCYTTKRRPLVLKYYETNPFLKYATERQYNLKVVTIKERSTDTR